MLSILGWVAWGIVLLCALSWAYGLRVYTKKGLPVPVPTLVQGFFLSAIAIVFFFTSYSKLHIFWVAPMCILASLYLTLGRNVPVLTPLVLWFAGLYAEIVLLGLKRPNAHSD